MATSGYYSIMLRAALLLLIAITANAASSQAQGGQGAQTDSAPRFPPVEGSSLEGRKFLLPADFEGELNVVFVAFKREQQADVMTWTPYVKDAVAKHPGLRAYEIPTLSRSLRFIRRVIDGGMSRGIPDKTVRETTIPLYIDKAPFERALHVASEDSIRVLLVARGGRVVWWGDGVYAEPMAAQLTAAIASAFTAAASARLDTARDR